MVLSLHGMSFHLVSTSDSQTVDLKTAIKTFCQSDHEPFHKTWERFIDLIHQCPYHGYTRGKLLQSFYAGLTEYQKIAVNAVAGRSFYSVGCEDAWEILEVLAEDSRQNTTLERSRGGASRRG